MWTRVVLVEFLVDNCYFLFFSVKHQKNSAWFEMNFCVYRSFLIWCAFLFCLNVRSQEEEANLMKAVVMTAIGEPSVLRLEQLPIPKISSDQLLIRVKAAGINRVDIYTRSGTSHRKPTIPTILGKEISGLVKEIGSSVKEFQIENRVFCGINEGGYAEYAAANATDCHHLPDQLSFSEGAALYITYLIAYRALVVKGNLTSNETLLVHGASGSLGGAVVQIAKSIGAVVLATVRDDRMDEVMKTAGADQIAYHEEYLRKKRNDTKYVAFLRKKNEPQFDRYLKNGLDALNRTSFDIVVDALRDLNLHRDKRYLSHGGRIIVMGKKVSDKINNWLFKPREGILHQASFTKYNRTDQLAAVQFITDKIKTGRVKPFIKREYSLEQAAQAHFDIAQDKVDEGKCVFVL